MQMIPHLLTQVQIVFLASGATIPWIGPCYWSDQYAGWYEQETHKLYICDEQDTVEYIEPTIYNMTIKEKMILNHELGHHIDFNLIQEDLKDQYKIEWEKSISIGSGQFLREYGMKNVQEGFADDFMYVMEGRYYYPRATTEDQKQIKKRTDIVRKIIKKLEFQARKVKKLFTTLTYYGK